jgi:uncharacterized membrane protein YphA (DoxX/SURF4 family)
MADRVIDRWFAPDVWSDETYSAARWLWLRALGCIFLSAFVSLAFRIEGLIGPRGILPAGDYLRAVHNALGWKGYWLAPTLLWLNASRGALEALVIIGGLASLAIIFNLWPRIATAIAMIAFLSFIGAAQDFASYQSDGMLMEGAFLTLFLAPRPSRASVWLLRWEWFRIYFESGLVKILSGEPQWRNLTAMDRYYENGPLPTWLGWYVQQHLPHGFHAASAAYTLLVELFLCWLVFFGRRSRIALFVLTTPLQLAIILTANYAFLNYLVLCLGVFLLDDRVLRRPNVGPALQPAFRVVLPAVVLPTHLLTTAVMFFIPGFPVAVLLEPTRIVNSYGLFAVMTRNRYELEFQGTRDGVTWIAYPFRCKPQDPRERPGIYAPYQPRFDWNLWFASLGGIEDYPWVASVQVRLLENEPDVLRLFAGNPFGARPPAAVRVVRWQYWFTTPGERLRTGAWWRRELRGEYSPPLQLSPVAR